MGDSTVPQRMKASGAPLGKHRARLTDEEFAIMCWLRTNPKVASKYGITSCNGDTRIGVSTGYLLPHRFSRKRSTVYETRGRFCTASYQ